MTGVAVRHERTQPRTVAGLPVGTGLIVISPHLDDGVLSCGDLLAQNAGALVVTAFAGRAPSRPPLTSWDERGGFEDGADVVAARREEDRQALAVLGAHPVWLPFPDPQYGTKPSRREVAKALTVALDDARPDAVAMPLGIFHDDHILASDAAIDALRLHAPPIWLVYADAIYRRVPDLVKERLRGLDGLGLTLHALDVPAIGAGDRKQRAVACYRSQVRALERSWDDGVTDAFGAERYWQVVRRDVALPPSARLVDEDRDGDDR